MDFIPREVATEQKKKRFSTLQPVYKFHLLPSVVKWLFVALKWLFVVLGKKLGKKIQTVAALTE